MICVLMTLVCALTARGAPVSRLWCSCGPGGSCQASHGQQTLRACITDTGTSSLIHSTVCAFLCLGAGVLAQGGHSIVTSFLPRAGYCVCVCVCWGYFVQNQAAYGSRLLGVQGLWDRGHEDRVPCAAADEPSVSVGGRGGQTLQLDSVGGFPCQCPFVTATVELLSARCFPPWSPPCYKEEPSSPL